MPESDFYLSHWGRGAKMDKLRPNKEETVLKKKKEFIYFMLLLMCSVFEDVECSRTFKHPTHNPEAYSTTTSWLMPTLLQVIF